MGFRVCSECCVALAQKVQLLDLFDQLRMLCVCSCHGGSTLTLLYDKQKKVNNWDLGKDSGLTSDKVARVSSRSRVTWPICVFRRAFSCFPSSSCMSTISFSFLR